MFFCMSSFSTQFAHFLFFAFLKPLSISCRNSFSTLGDSSNGCYWIGNFHIYTIEISFFVLFRSFRRLLLSFIYTLLSLLLSFPTAAYYHPKIYILFGGSNDHYIFQHYSLHQCTIDVLNFWYIYEQLPSFVFISKPLCHEFHDVFALDEYD